MDIQSVLVEKSDTALNNVFASSGVMLEKKYVVISSNALTPLFKEEDVKYFQQLNSATLYLCPAGTKFDQGLNVVWKTEKETNFTVRKANIFVIFVCDNIKNSRTNFFTDWSVDSIGNCADLPEKLSLFFALKIEGSNGNFKDFRGVLRNWWTLVGGIRLEKGDDVTCNTAAFGNRQFLNSTSKGIVSNIFGKNLSLFLSDCPTTPGSEGGPVFVCGKRNNKKNIPIGLILSSSIWWQKEWVGLTLIADIRPMLLQMIDDLVHIENLENEKPHFKLLAATEHSLVQVYSGNLKGTAVLLSREKGIFITNSHVICGDKSDLTLKWRNVSWPGRVMYRSTHKDAYDLAVIKCDFGDKPNLELHPCNVHTLTECKAGDEVYSAGFSLLPKQSDPTPVICKGYISSLNKFIIKTTCSVHPGTSGGALFDAEGFLLGIIVCNVKLEEKRVYPRFSVVIPISAIWNGLETFLDCDDIGVLKQLTAGDQAAQVAWYQLEGKL